MSIAYFMICISVSVSLDISHVFQSILKLLETVACNSTIYPGLCRWNRFRGSLGKLLNSVGAHVEGDMGSKTQDLNPISSPFVNGCDEATVRRRR